VQLTGKNSEQHLEENLALFVSLLRQEGLPVGTTEMIDALLALQKIDLSSRSDFKTALQTTLAKNYRDQMIFSRLFDYFFVSAEKHRSRIKESIFHNEEITRQLEQANLELQFKGEALDLSLKELKQYNALLPEQRKRLQDFVQRTESGHKVEPQFRPILETVVKSHLRYCRSQNELRNHSNSFAGESGGAGSGGGRDDILTEIDIEMITSADLPAAEQLLQRLSRKLAVQILHRRYQGPRSGPLDLRRSMRDNLRYGGITFNLKHKPKRSSKHHILLLCDVSASMKKYSTFVIHFLRGLNEAVRNLSCFSFSDNLEDLTAGIENRVSLKQMLDRVIRHSKNWGGGTDIGLALRKLAEGYPDRLNAKTTVIVVSDTRTIALDQAVKELEKLKDRVKRVIWLNPLPIDNWVDFRSISLVAERVEMWPCSTISQLEEVLAGRL
jgi:uncharacterized protein